MQLERGNGDIQYLFEVSSSTINSNQSEMRYIQPFVVL